MRQSEEKYRTLVENSLMGISQALPDGRLVQVNEAYVKMYGYDTAGQMMNEIKDIGQQLYVNQEDRMEVLRILTEKGIMEPREFAVRRRDGSVINILAAACVIKDASGKVVCYQATHMDITERKQSEEKIKQQLAELLRWQSTMLDREDRVQKLKKEINELSAKLGQPKKYGGG